MTRVRDILTADLVMASPDLTLRNLVELLADKHIGGVPVLAGTRVVGVVSMDDVVAFLSSQPVVPTTRPQDADDEWEEPEPQEGDEPPGGYFADAWSDAGADLVERFSAPCSPEWDLLGEHAVAEAMSRRIWSIAPTADAGRDRQLRIRCRRGNLHRPGGGGDRGSHQVGAPGAGERGVGCKCAAAHRGDAD